MLAPASYARVAAAAICWGVTARFGLSFVVAIGPVGAMVTARTSVGTRCSVATGLCTTVLVNYPSTQAKRLDLGRRHLQNGPQDVIGVCAVVGPGPVPTSSHVGGSPGELRRVLLDWPCADLLLLQLHHPLEVAELRIAVTPIFGGLTHA